jgi:hypothetical protein
LILNIPIIDFGHVHARICYVRPFL